VAFYPCSAHGTMYRGAAEAAYPAIVEGGASDREHLRLCHECFEDYLVGCRDSLSEVIVGAKEPANGKRACYVCSAPGAHAAIFVTVYPKGSDERQFFGAVCSDHMDNARAAWLLNGA